jgi:cytochrome P450
MSFMPFLAGKRICVGKTFAEYSLKVVFSLIFKAFSKLEFENPKFYSKKPAINIFIVNKPEINVKLHF